MRGPSEVERRAKIKRASACAEPFFVAKRPILGLFLVAVFLFPVRAEHPRAADPPAPGPRGRKAESKQKLLREGERLQRVPGRFEPAGDRFVFVVENSPQRFLVLENLNLERVLKMGDIYPAPIRWVVSGEITEFRKENYLIVERATFSSLFRKNDLETKEHPGGEFEEKP